MKIHHYNLPLKPLPWPITKHPANLFYDTQKHIRTSYVIYLEQQHGNKKPLQGALELHREYYFPIPDLLRKRPTNNDMWMYTMPAFDHCNKLLIESLKMAGVIKDDKYICKESGIKKYSKDPRIVVTITELET